MHFIRITLVATVFKHHFCRYRICLTYFQSHLKKKTPCQPYFFNIEFPIQVQGPVCFMYQNMCSYEVCCKDTVTAFQAGLLIFATNNSLPLQATSLRYEQHAQNRGLRYEQHAVPLRTTCQNFTSFSWTA